MCIIEPIILSTDRIELLPLAMEHLPAFHNAANFDDMWAWVRPNPCSTMAATQQWIETALEAAELGQQIPFVIIDKASGNLVGSTRYLNIREADRGIEIGHTWINRDHHRSYVNTHAKYCLLKHAFETLGAIRIELLTHENNQRSRNAITRIGGQFEGIMRQQRILPDGSYRNTALFSIIDSEWQALKPRLLHALDSRYK